MENKTDTNKCVQCDCEYSIDGDYGAYASDGAFICHHCLSGLINLKDEQYED